MTWSAKTVQRGMRRPDCLRLADIQKAFGKLNRWLRHRVCASIRLRDGRMASLTALHHLLKQLHSKAIKLKAIKKVQSEKKRILLQKVTNTH
jgi:hypothetical protein